MNRPSGELDAELEDRLRFEMLLTELSARFVSVTAETSDKESMDAQRQIVQALGLDRGTLGELQDGNWVLTHSWALPGLDAVPGIVAKELPWFARILARGEEVCWARIGDLPEEAARDKAVVRRIGPQSSAVFPSKVRGKVVNTTAKEDLLKGKKAGDSTFKVDIDGYNLLPAFQGEKLSDGCI
jgi:formate hydrogenlyase transcriptional activator